MKNLILISASVLALAACGQQAEQPAVDAAPAESTLPAQQAAASQVAGPVAVEDPWCRPTPNGAKTGACYVILTATADDTLKSISTDISEHAEVHEMKLDNGMMSMSPLPDGLPLEAGVRNELKPHGTHLMLTGLKSPLVNGQRIKITLTFAKAEPQTLDFAIRTPPVVGGEQ